MDDGVNEFPRNKSKNKKLKEIQIFENFKLF